MIQLLSANIMLHGVSKNVPFSFLTTSANVNHLHNFGTLNPEELSHKWLQSCPPHLKNATALPW